MSFSNQKEPSIVDDFMYGTNVATAAVSIRLGFLRKVYGILTTQLAVTTVVGFLFMMHEGLKSYVQQNNWLLFVALFGTLGVLFPLMLKRQETPTNYILLAAFFVILSSTVLRAYSVMNLANWAWPNHNKTFPTIMEAYSVGVIVTFYDKLVVLEAFVLTLGVTAALTMYTLQSKRDFSSWGAGLFACLWVLILAGLMQLFFPVEMVDKAIAIGGAILFALFIIFDTHMMMTKLSPEEYILASINLYLDIINLFLHILRLLSERRN